MTVGTSPLNILLSLVGIALGTVVAGLLFDWSAPATVGGGLFGGILGSLLSELVVELPASVQRRLGRGGLAGVAVGLLLGGAFVQFTPDLSTQQQLDGLGIAAVVGAVTGAIVWAGVERVRELWSRLVALWHTFRRRT